MFLEKFKHKLSLSEIIYYSGSYIKSNHVELHAAAMRADRMSPFKMDTGLAIDESFRARVRERVCQFVALSNCHCHVFSAEGLSYLRHDDEMDRLKSMMPEGSIEIVVYLREPASFMASYRAEMKKHRLPDVIDRDSFAYVADDSWLMDFDNRVARFRNAFGSEKVTVLDYDHEVRETGNVIPSFLRVLGVESLFRPQDWSEFYLNRRPPA